MASPHPRCVSGPSMDLSAEYLGPLRILPTHVALLSLFPGTEVSSLCQKGGVCIDSGPSHFCHCPPGFQGSICQDQVNPCESRPCQHGATCVAQPNGYLCQVRRSRGGGGEDKVGLDMENSSQGAERVGRRHFHLPHTSNQPPSQAVLPPEYFSALSLPLHPHPTALVQAFISFHLDTCISLLIINIIAASTLVLLKVHPLFHL